MSEAAAVSGAEAKNEDEDEQQQIVAVALQPQIPQPSPPAALVVLYPPIYLEAVPYVLYFGDDAVDEIYVHCTPHELVRLTRVCRRMRTNMPRIAERIVCYFLKRKYYNSRHVRVPNPGEVLHQDAATNGGAPIVAASFLRQYRDMTRQRVLLMGGCVDIYGFVEVNRVDMLDTFPKPKTEEGKEEEEEGGGVKIEHLWESCPPMLLARKWFSVEWFRGEVFSFSSSNDEPGRGTVERIDTLSKKRTLLQQPLPLPSLRGLSTAVLDEKLYIIGGQYKPTPAGNWVWSDAMYCFVDHPTDPSAATWALQSAKLNTPRSHHASIVFQRRIWVAGGFDSNSKMLSSVEVFAAAVNKWESAPAMVRKRRYFKLVVVENELYAVGGEFRQCRLKS